LIIAKRMLASALGSPQNVKDMLERGPKNAWVGAEKYIQLGLTPLVAIFFGWLLGEWLKRRLHYDWLPFAGLILGTVSGFVYLVRAALSKEFKD